MQVKELYNNFNYVYSAGEYFIPFYQARSFIDKCLTSNLLIVGIEVFIINDQGTLPLTDFIADFSFIIDTVPKDSRAFESHRLSVEFFKIIEEKDCVYLTFVLN